MCTSWSGFWGHFLFCAHAVHSSVWNCFFLWKQLNRFLFESKTAIYTWQQLQVRALSWVLASAISNTLPKSSTRVCIDIYMLPPQKSSNIDIYRSFFSDIYQSRKKPIFISPKKNDIYRVKKKPIFDIYLIFTDIDIKH